MSNRTKQSQPDDLSKNEHHPILPTTVISHVQHLSQITHTPSFEWDKHTAKLVPTHNGDSFWCYNFWSKKVRIPRWLIAVVFLPDGAVFFRLVQAQTVAISTDCIHAAVGCSDGTVYTYNLRTRELLEAFSGQSGSPVSNVVISTDQHFVFSAVKVRFGSKHQSRSLAPT